MTTTTTRQALDTFLEFARSDTTLRPNDVVNALLEVWAEVDGEARKLVEHVLSTTVGPARRSFFTSEELVALGEAIRTAR